MELESESLSVAEAEETEWLCQPNLTECLNLMNVHEYGLCDVAKLCGQ